VVAVECHDLRLLLVDDESHFGCLYSELLELFDGDFDGVLEVDEV
jgi:hypothetical protein